MSEDFYTVPMFCFLEEIITAYGTVKHELSAGADEIICHRRFEEFYQKNLAKCKNFDYLLSNEFVVKEVCIKVVPSECYELRQFLNDLFLWYCRTCYLWSYDLDKLLNDLEKWRNIIFKQSETKTPQVQMQGEMPKFLKELIDIGYIKTDFTSLVSLNEIAKYIYESGYVDDKLLSQILKKYIKKGNGQQYGKTAIYNAVTYAKAE